MQIKYTPTVRTVYYEIRTQIRNGRVPWFAYDRFSERALVYIQPHWLKPLADRNMDGVSGKHQLDFIQVFTFSIREGAKNVILPDY